MTGYTKLFGHIVHSTIWREPAHVRIVWVTMLALKDRNGNVFASVPGLADVSRVSRVECESALAKLLAPDPDSRSKVADGRRISEIEGGWHIVNHDHYRDLMSEDDQREKARKRKQRQREREAMSRSVTPSHAESRVKPGHTKSRRVTDVRHADADADPERKIPPTPRGSPRRDPFAESFAEQPTERADVAELLEAFKTSTGLHGWKFRGPHCDDAKALAERIDKFSLEKCLLVARHCMSDGMVTGRTDENGQTHKTIRYVFGNHDAFLRIMHDGEKREPERGPRTVTEQLAAAKAAKVS